MVLSTAHLITENQNFLLNSPRTQHHIFFRNSPLYSKINPVALGVGVGDINGRPACPLEGSTDLHSALWGPRVGRTVASRTWPSNSCYREEIVLKNVSHRITRLDHEEEHSCRSNGTSCRFSLACLLHRGFFLRVRVIPLWNSLPRDAVCAESIKCFQAKLNPM